MQAYPFVVRKVLRNSSNGTSLLLRDMLFDERGSVRPARMSAVLNAALGHVAARTDGFVDLDAVPAEGAPLQVPAAACSWKAFGPPSSSYCASNFSMLGQSHYNAVHNV